MTHHHKTGEDIVAGCADEQDANIGNRGQRYLGLESTATPDKYNLVTIVDQVCASKISELLTVVAVGTAGGVDMPERSIFS
jgi:hypothetical protein